MTKRTCYPSEIIGVTVSKRGWACHYAVKDIIHTYCGKYLNKSIHFTLDLTELENHPMYYACHACKLRLEKWRSPPQPRDPKKRGRQPKSKQSNDKQEEMKLRRE